MDEYTGTYFDSKRDRYVSLEYSYVMNTVVVSDYYTERVIEEISAAFLDKESLIDVPEQTLQDTRKILGTPAQEPLQTKDGEANPMFDYVQGSVTFEEAKQMA